MPAVGRDFGASAISGVVLLVLAPIPLWLMYRLVARLFGYPAPEAAVKCGNGGHLRLSQHTDPDLYTCL